MGGFEPGMAEEFRDVTDVGAAFEHPRRCRVAQEVTGAGFAGPGVDIRTDRARQPVEGQWPARRADEQQPRIGVGCEVRSGVGEICVDPTCGSRAEGCVPVAGTFPVADEQRRGSGGGSRSSSPHSCAQPATPHVHRPPGGG